ncbi:hypothetical protein HAX54_043347 [Datura stramonium]|uniref:Uncharacterized protein n=1 Tax=Datura stramonium TaxID=4076 RepID=A0ABS8W2P1_DATST|nr:hypothetical protein [Datura stramonium]
MIGQKQTLDEGGDGHKWLHPPAVPETSTVTPLLPHPPLLSNKDGSANLQPQKVVQPKEFYLQITIQVSMIGARGQTLAIVTRHKFVLITDRSISTLMTVNPISWVTPDGNTALFLGGQAPSAPSDAAPVDVPDSNSPKKPKLMGDSDSVIK